jgi:hypothetical protein
MKMLFLTGLIIVATSASPVVWATNRWYQVEVIVFRHADSELMNREQWPDLESLPDYRDSIRLFVDLPELTDEPPVDGPNEGLAPGPLAFQSLSANQLKMSGVFRRLRNVSAYEAVLHVGWRQPGGGQSRARRVYISDDPATFRGIDSDTASLRLGSQDNSRRIEGVIRVRGGRLLHMDADFTSYGGPAPVRISERRKVKFKELHYFDHPLFGVIVQVTPYRISDLAAQSKQTSDAAPSVVH